MRIPEFADDVMNENPVYVFFRIFEN